MRFSILCNFWHFFAKWNDQNFVFEDFFNFHFSMHEIYLFGTKVGQMMTDLPTLPIFKGRSHTKKKIVTMEIFFCTWSNFFLLWKNLISFSNNYDTFINQQTCRVTNFAIFSVKWEYFNIFLKTLVLFLKVGYTVTSLIKT